MRFFNTRTTSRRKCLGCGTGSRDLTQERVGGPTTNDPSPVTLPDPILGSPVHRFIVRKDTRSLRSSLITRLPRHRRICDSGNG